MTWWPDLGAGFYPVSAGIAPYDQEYFDRFTRQAETDIGRTLMASREKFVAAFWRGPLVDVGIGSGAFVALRNARGRRTLGYDVNPAGLAWLNARGLFCDPYHNPPEPNGVGAWLAEDAIRHGDCGDDGRGPFGLGVRAVSLWDVLEHIPDFDRLLANVRSFVFISIPIFRDGAHAAASKHFRPTEHVWYFTPDGLIRTMDQLGFRLLSCSNFEEAAGREDIGAFAFRRDGAGLEDWL